MKKLVITIFILCLAMFPDAIYACATCFGNPNAAATQGMNKAILSMLGITGGVLGGVGSSIFILHRRAKEYAKSIKDNKN